MGEKWLQYPMNPLAQFTSIINFNAFCYPRLLILPMHVLLMHTISVVGYVLSRQGPQGLCRCCIHSLVHQIRLQMRLQMRLERLDSPRTGGLIPTSLMGPWLWQTSINRGGNSRNSRINSIRGPVLSIHGSARMLISNYS